MLSTICNFNLYSFRVKLSLHFQLSFFTSRLIQVVKSYFKAEETIIWLLSVVDISSTSPCFTVLTSMLVLLMVVSYFFIFAMVFIKKIVPIVACIQKQLVRNRSFQGVRHKYLFHINVFVRNRPL